MLMCWTFMSTFVAILTNHPTHEFHERSIENYHSYFLHKAYGDRPAPATTSTLPQLVPSRSTGSTRSSRWPRLTLSPMAHSRQRRVRRGRRFLCYSWVPHYRTSIRRTFP